MPKYQLDTVGEVGTVDELRAYTGRSSAVVISQGDAPALYVFDESDLTSVDDGLDVIVGYNNRRWIRISNNAGELTDAVTAAEEARDDAQEALAETEIARDSALAAARIYASTAAGLAAVASGEYFYVPSTEDGESLILYLDNAGVAEEVSRFMDADRITGLLDTTDTDWALQFVDDMDKVIGGFRDDGTFETVEVKTDAQTINDFEMSAPSESAGYLFSIEDASGNTAFGIKPSGGVDVDLTRSSLPTHHHGYGGVRYHAQVNFVINTGQSLAAGASGTTISDQPYDNSKLNLSTSTEFTAGYETGLTNPAAGSIAYPKQLLEELNGVSYTEHTYRLVYHTSAAAANTIAQLSPGGSSGKYEAAVVAMSSAKAIADAGGLSFAVNMVTWTQGEADGALTEAQYKAAEISLAEAYNTAAKALGQKHDIRFVSYQCCSVGSATNKAVPVAQWKAGMEHPLIRVACPIYHMAYGDFQHLTAASEDWLGGYYGLVYYTELILGKRWEPLQPVDVRIVGDNLDVFFNKKDLELDTSLMPSQTNSGFSVENSSGVAQTINSVTLLEGGRVRLAIAATPAADWRVKYGHNSVTGKSPFVGGGGNLRDNQGDYFVYRTNPMHNWCVIFDWKV